MLNEFDGIIDLLRSDGSIIINKNLAFEIGLEPAIVYIELLGKYKYFKERNMLTDDGYFFNTVDNFRLDTTLPDKRQRKAIKELVELGLIKKDLRGLPPKRHFKPVQSTDKVLQLINNGKEKRAELKEKLAEKTDKSKNRYFEGIESSISEETNIPSQNVNNTNLNYTNFNNTKKGKREGNVVSSYVFSDNEVQNYLKEEYPNTHEWIAENVQYYLDMYESYRGKKHPRMKLYQWQDVFNNITHAYDDREHGKEIDLIGDIYPKIVRQHFETEYQQGCDYHLPHFVSGNIIMNRYYEVF